MTGAKREARRCCKTAYFIFIVPDSSAEFPQLGSPNVAVPQFQCTIKASKEISVPVLVAFCVPVQLPVCAPHLPVTLCVPVSVRSGYRVRIWRSPMFLCGMVKAAGGGAGRGGAELAVSAGAGHHARLCPLSLSKPAGHSHWF